MHSASSCGLPKVVLVAWWLERRNLKFSGDLVPRLQKCPSVICWKSVSSSQCCSGLTAYLAHAHWLLLYNSRLLQMISQNPLAPCPRSGQGQSHSTCDFSLCCLRDVKGWIASDSLYAAWVYPGCALSGCLERDRALKLCAELFHWLHKGDMEWLRTINAICGVWNMTWFHQRGEQCVWSQAWL